MNNPKKYFLHSGGASGSDLAWDRIGKQFGIPAANMHHYRPEHYHDANPDTKLLIDASVEYAADCLGRPWNFNGIDLVKRNWFQVANSEAVYAIGRIIKPGEKNIKGFKNKVDHDIVDGGTGWAVQMAINMGKLVYVYDMLTNGWYVWVPGLKQNRFVPNAVNDEFIAPELTKTFAGIGSRELTREGEDAIISVYENTFKQ